MVAGDTFSELLRGKEVAMEPTASLSEGMVVCSIADNSVSLEMQTRTLDTN
jgi:hypothetical protein